MNRAVTSLLVMTLLLVLVISPFSALAMLMMFLVVGAIVGIISSLVQIVLHHNPQERSDN
jgi:disulfide bond formation protein DsbB